MKTKLAVLFSFALSACGVSSTSAEVGSRGGSVSLSSALTLDVPPGAVDDGTVITVREVEPRHGELEFELEPRGLQLRVPADVSVASGTELRMFHRENELEHGVASAFDGHHQRWKLDRLGGLVLRHPEVGDDHGSGGHGADDVDGGTADGGVDDHGSGGHGGDDTP